MSRFALGFLLGTTATMAVALGAAGLAHAHRLELPHVQLPSKSDVLGRLGLPADLELPRDIELPQLRAPRGPVVVYLDRDGGRIDAGSDSPLLRRSGVVARSAMTHVEVPKYRGGDRRWNAFVGCVASNFADFDVVVTDERPSGSSYMTVMVGGDPKSFDFENTVGGIAPYDGSVLRDAVVFVFEKPHTNTQTLCETASHEIGHAMGLDHTRSCKDVMSYERCGNKTFQTTPVPCGEWAERTCANGRPTQSSWERLADQVGLREDHRYT